ncbi:hypothetical protein ABZS76_32520 [Streptomyces sp. NPDC005562]|uniref:DUF7847 domain-containing protein n=1 Tax=Streptomyces sp. NPDC005562 TaxID=3154890 RepID=UPI0033B8D3EA
MSDTSGWGPQQGRQDRNPHPYPHGRQPYPPGPRPYPWGTPPPPPPKPGVIPLGPLGVDQVLGGAFATMRRYAKPLFVPALAAYAVLAVIMVAAFGVVYAATRDDVDALGARDSPAWEHVRPILFAFGALWVLATLGALAVNSFVQATCAATLHDAVLGRAADVRAVCRRARSRTPAVAAVTLVLALVLMMPVGAFALLLFTFVALILAQTLIPVMLVFPLLLVTIPLAAWLYVLFALAPAAAVLEGAGPFTALRRSVRLVRGAWWRTFGISLLAGVIVMVVSLLFQLPLQLGAPEPTAVAPGTPASEVFVDQLRSQSGLYALAGLLCTLLVQLLAAVFLPLVTALLYLDRRIRKEGLAHALAEASGPPR